MLIVGILELETGIFLMTVHWLLSTAKHGLLLCTLIIAVLFGGQIENVQSNRIVVKLDFEKCLYLQQIQQILRVLVLL